jgi:hypothetical protein
MMERLTDDQKVEWLQNNLNWTTYDQLLKLGMTPENQVYIFDEITDHEDYSCGDVHAFAIVGMPLGKKQNSHKWDFYVDQQQHGEDWYTGHCYLKISENKYLCWYFSV